jgi:hypothetical protein
VLRLLERIAVATLRVSRWVVAATIATVFLFVLFVVVFLATAYARHRGIPPLLVDGPLAIAGTLFAIWVVRHVNRLRDIYDAVADDAESYAPDDLDEHHQE